MEIKNCPECGKIFAFSIVNLCPNCQKEEEAEFQRVKEYLYESPNTGIYDLAAATEVDEHKILRWLKTGRLEGKKFPGVAYPCESCGRNIQEGRYCSSCSSQLAKGFSQAKEPPKGNKDDDYRPKFHTRG